jgi:hypothetical protein
MSFIALVCISIMTNDVDPFHVLIGHTHTLTHIYIYFFFSLQKCYSFLPFVSVCLLFISVNYTEEFHCNISIHAYNVGGTGV